MYSTWLEIDLGAIQNNVHQLLQITGCDVMAVVKANGYGHGMLESAEAAYEAGASCFGVATVDEAVKLGHSTSLELGEKQLHLF